MFKTYSEALSAIKEIKTYVLGNVDSEVEVRYSLIKPDLPYRYPRKCSKLWARYPSDYPIKKHIETTDLPTEMNYRHSSKYTYLPNK